MYRVVRPHETYDEIAESWNVEALYGFIFQTAKDVIDHKAKIEHQKLKDIKVEFLYPTQMENEEAVQAFLNGIDQYAKSQQEFKRMKMVRDSESMEKRNFYIVHHTFVEE